MNSLPYKYRAFISYKHAKLDKYWANWLVRSIEGYRIPKPLIEFGQSSKVGKCYRDEDESVAGGKLSNQITDALDNSEFLIVIGSHSTLTSKWVPQEIEHFVNGGRAHRILPLLIEGEPKTSFPKILFDASNGELLAADLRTQEGVKKRDIEKNALLKLIAPMLGHEFDTLKQRNKLREQSRKLRLFSVIALVIMTVAMIFLWSQYKIAEEAKTSAERALSEKSNILASFADIESSNENHTTALLLALEGVNHNPEFTGERIAAVDRIVREANLIRESIVTPKEIGLVTSASFSKRSDLFLTTSTDKTASIRDRTSGSLITILRGHKGTVLNGEFSSTGQYVVTASDYKTAKIWVVDSGEEYFQCDHTGRVTSAKFSDDGNLVVTASVDGTAKVWDIQKKSHLYTLTIDKAAIESHPLRYKPEAIFSRDGQYIITNFGGKIANIWNAKTGNLHGSLSGHTDNISSLAVSRNSKFAITTSDDYTAKLWNLDTAGEIEEFSIDKRGLVSVLDANFSQNSLQVILSGSNGLVKIFSTSGAERGSFPTGDVRGVVSVRISPNNRIIATASYDGFLRLWNKETFEPLFALNGHEKFVRSFEFSQDSKSIITASNDGTARIWDIAGNDISIQIEENSEFLSTQIFNDGDKFVTASSDGAIQIWDAITGKAIYQMGGHSKAVNKVDLSSDNRLIVTASDDKTVRVWDSVTGNEMYVHSEHDGKVYDVSFSNQNNTIVTASDKSAHILDITTGDVVVLDHKNAEVKSASFSPDGKYILTGTKNNAYLWSSSEGKKIHSFDMVVDLMGTPKFSPNSQYVIIPTGKTGAHIWSIAPIREIRVLKDQSLDEPATNFSPNSELVATASSDNTVGIWSVSTGDNIATFKGHTGSVTGIEFSHDGNLIATISDDRTVRIWNVKTGTQLAKNSDNFRYINAVKFTPNDESIVTVSESGALIWHLNDTLTTSQKFMNSNEQQHWVFATGAKLAPRCLTPKEREAYNLSVDPPCWCREKSFPNLSDWEIDYSKRRKSDFESAPNEETNLPAPNPFTSTRTDEWTCPPKGQGYSAPWMSKQDVMGNQ